MKLKLKRITSKPYTVGHLYINEKYFCDTIEPPYFNTKQEDSIESIKKTKIGNTAIPIGTYKIDMNTVSPTFKDRSWAQFCNGKLPRLVDVPAFNGVLIHVGNTASQYGGDSKGCILVGFNKIKGKVVNSTNTFKSLYSQLLQAVNNNESITIKIEK